ncbi:MAG TPA: hypothetical protein VLM38_14070 [Blastocatellia bacterium]|nr:hypothetical protein [Blastocatellia bacterium]
MNQKDTREINKQTEPLTDLELTAELAEQSKAGTGTHSTGGGGGAGKVSMRDSF